MRLKDSNPKPKTLTSLKPRPQLDEARARSSLSISLLSLTPPSPPRDSRLFHRFRGLRRRILPLDGRG
jgi:hypothetical protein